LTPAAPPLARRIGAPLALGSLALSLLLAVIVALSHGAYPIAPGALLRALAAAPGLADAAAETQQAAVLTMIRAPRVLLAVLTGAGLALAGSLMQGLFRNPLADPGLIGVSAGGALAAAAVIVLGGSTPALFAAGAHVLALPLAAFSGSLLATTLVYRVGSAQGLLSLPLMLLAGIAVNAVAFAGIGLLVFVASDEQIRTLTFWNLGSLGAATWWTLAAVGPPVLATLVIGLRLAQALNALALGETRAEHLGVDVRRLKHGVVLLTALASGCLVAVTGVIGFVGLVAPHMVRLACGPDQRIVLPGAALLGAALVVAADLVARTVVSPAELPIGILTALIGAPFFFALLLRRRAQGGL
jgi:iron complex transport system permease protein